MTSGNSPMCIAAESFWAKEVVWVAVSAIATVCYLIASILLWLTTRANTKAALRQAEIATEQLKLSKEMLDATVKQAQAATDQFNLTKQAFIEARRPLLWFRLAEVRPFRQGVPEGVLICDFILRNGGNAPASELQWNVTVETNRGPIQHFKVQSEFPTDVVPASEWPQSVTIDDKFLLTHVREFQYIDVAIEAFYVNPFDEKERKTEHKTWCVIRYQPGMNRSGLRFAHMY